MSGSESDWVTSLPRPPLFSGWRSGSRYRVAGFLLAILTGAALGVLPTPLAAAIVASGAILFGILLRPEIGVLLLVPAVPFGSFRQLSLGAVHVGLTEALAVVVILSWLARHSTRRRSRLLLPPLAVPMLAVLAALLLSTIRATSLQLSVSEIIKWMELVAIYVLVYNEFDERWDKALLIVLLLTGAAAAAHGAYQFLFRVGPEGFVLFGSFMRAHGTFGQPNPFAGYLGLTLPLAGGIVVAGLAGGRLRIPWRWVLAGSICGALMLCAAIMSWSRGAWLGITAALISLAIAVLWRPGRARGWILILVVLLVCGVLLGGWARVPTFISQRLSDLAAYVSVTDARGVEITDSNYAVLERLAHWQAAWSMWMSRPWLGIGTGNYEVAYAQHRLPLWPEPLGHAHNYYLNMAAETGLVGLLSLSLLGVMALLGLLRAIRRTAGLRLGVLLGALGMIVHLSVHSVFDNLFVHGMYLQMGLILGLAANAARWSKEPDPEQVRNG